MRKLLTALLCLLMLSQAKAQGNLEKVLAYLKQQGIVSKPEDWKVTDEIFQQETRSTYLYLRQVYQGIEIYNTSISVMLKDGEVKSFTGKVHKDFTLARGSRFRLNSADAVKKIAKDLMPQVPLQLRLLPASEQSKIGVEVYDKGNVSYEPIPTKKVYFLDDKNQLHAAWNLSIAPIGSVDWWDIVLDANSGKTIQKNNWTTKCNFDYGNLAIPQKHQHSQHCTNENAYIKEQRRVDGASYRVFDLPVESPIHGARTLVTNPADALASPYGWHDTNGAAGAEFTITRGNNVHAYEDRANTNTPGLSPDGGVSLNFDFPYNTSMLPADYLDFAITNTFYISNIVHDIFYHLGFNEAAGNFQVNNYGRGGIGNDDVRAEAQDGSGRNNANFATPPDGSRPRMQMFIWDARTEKRYLSISSPASVSGVYTTGTATFGPSVTGTPVSGQLALVNDGSANPTLGCVAMTAGSLSGKIAVIDRGSCAFTIKVKAAQDAGAIGAIIVNNVAGSVFNMSGTDASITIPSVMISLADGITLKNAMQLGTVVGALVVPPTPPAVDTDSDLDNGIIIHEYGHGISTRLTGGPANSSCLNNEEQMGEGWSDYFSLVLTMKASDVATQPRGMGTYVMGQTTSGNGIRPAPYSVNRFLNNYTYSDLPSPSLSVPHGVGFVWATILWDMTWKFVDRYGFDANLKTGNGGNRRALRLVVEGLKLQPCNPGFVDGRDAILRANQELYGGADLDIIWQAFADRGLGYYANQGSSDSRSDGTADFTVPPTCAADAGNLARPSNAPSGAVIQLEEGTDIGAFRKTYNNVNQKDPADPNNTYTFGQNYTYGFLLTRNDTILTYNTSGDFDYSILPKGTYRVWGFSLKTVPNTLAQYMEGKVKINEIQDDIVADAICGKLTNNYTATTSAVIEIVAKSAATPDQPLSITKDLKGKIQVYPNPSNTDFNISIADYSGKPLKMSIFNAQGKLIESRQLSVQSASFNEKVKIANWARGVYLIKIEGDGQLFTDKLIVE